MNRKPKGKKVDLREFLGDQRNVTDLPTAPAQRAPEKPKIDDADGSVFARRDFAAEDAARDEPTLADVADDWRGTATQTQPTQSRGVADEDWTDFRSAQPSAEDAFKEPEWGDFRTAAPAASAESTTERKWGDFRTAEVSSVADIPAERAWSDLRGAAVHNDKPVEPSGRRKLNLKPRTKPLPGTQSATVNNESSTNNSAASNGHDDAHRSKWDKIFPTENKRENAVTGRESVGSRSLENHDAPSTRFSAAFGGSRPTLAKDMPPAFSNASKPSQREIPNAFTGRTTTRELSTAFSSNTRPGNNREMPAAFSAMRRRDDSTREMPSAFNNSSRNQRSDVHGGVFAADDELKSDKAHQRLSALNLIEKSEHNTPNPVSAKVVAVKAAAMDPELAKATIKRQIGKVLEDYVVDLSKDATAVAIEKIRAMCDVHKTVVFTEIMIKLVESESKSDFRALYRLVSVAIQLEVFDQETFWHSLDIVLSSKASLSASNNLVDAVKGLLKANIVQVPTLSATKYERVFKWLTENGLSTNFEEQRSPDEILNSSLDELRQFSTSIRGSDLAREFVKVLDRIHDPVCGALVMLVALEEAERRGMITAHANWVDDSDFGPALRASCSSENAGLAALFEMQHFMHTRGHVSTKGVLEGTFMQLLIHDIIEPDTFIAWKDDTSPNLPGKMKAVLATNGWFTWLNDQIREVTLSEA